ncbi:hypothetical protein D3C72_929700 [compost metagenome]
MKEGDNLKTLLYKAARDGSVFRTVRIDFKDGRRVEFSCGWSLQKGDWWAYKGVKRFFSFGRIDYDTGIAQLGVYIGRLALVTLKKGA